jgi:hypothetical protein
MIPGIVSASGGIGLDTPQLTTATSDLASYSFIITNYDSTYTYTLSTTAGGISRSTNTVSVTGLSNGTSATASVTATKVGYVSSSTATVTGSSIAGCTYTGYSYESINGGNCGTCGIISCGSGVPAYNTTWYRYTPYPCASGGTKVTGDVPVNGSWYCLTSGTGAGLSCGAGSNCCGWFPWVGCNN